MQHNSFKPTAACFTSAPLVTAGESQKTLTTPELTGDCRNVGAMIPGQLTTRGSDSRLVILSVVEIV